MAGLIAACEARMTRERALIEALARRYSDDPKADGDQLAQDYASAMRRLAARYPDDADIAVLAAEAGGAASLSAAQAASSETLRP